MNPRQLEIRRVYSASPSRARSVSIPRAGRLPVSVMGGLTLVVAASWLYAIWWPGDRLVSRNYMLAGLNMPMAGVGLGSMLGDAPEDLADPAPPEGTAAMNDEPAPPEPGPPVDRAESVARAQRNMRNLYIDIWVWVIVSTAGALWLGMTGAAILADHGRPESWSRRSLMVGAVIALLLAAIVGQRLWVGAEVPFMSPKALEVLLVVCVFATACLLALGIPRRTAGALAVVVGSLLLGFGGLAWYDWYSGEYAIFSDYPAQALRIAMAAFLLVAALAGAGILRRVIGVQKVAVALLLLAGITTVVALKFAESNAGVFTHELTTQTYAALAGPQVAFAVLMSAALALRLRRRA